MFHINQTGELVDKSQVFAVKNFNLILDKSEFLHRLESSLNIQCCLFWSPGYLTCQTKFISVYHVGTLMKCYEDNKRKHESESLGCSICKDATYLYLDIIFSFHLFFIQQILIWWYCAVLWNAKDEHNMATRLSCLHGEGMGMAVF